jgi:hypothetical protein
LNRSLREPGLLIPAFAPAERLGRVGRRIVGHIDAGFGFDRFGEFGAWYNVLHGEHSVRWTTGQHVDRKAFRIAL